MSVTRYLAKCYECDTPLRPLLPIGETCPNCKNTLRSSIRFRTAYVGGELIGAYGSGPKDAPWPEIKDGPLRGQNIVPSLSALKKHGKETGVVWQ